MNIEYLNLRTKELEKGGSLYDINPLGQVSTLKLANNEIITETSTTILWLQSQSRDKHFHISPSSPTFYQLARWIAFCATELHKQLFRVVFYPEATDEVKDRVRGLAPLRFEVLNQHLASRPYLLGDHFTAADAYLTWFFVLSENAKLDASNYEHLMAYRDRTLNRPLISALIKQDRAKDKAMKQEIIPS